MPQTRASTAEAAKKATVTTKTTNGVAKPKATRQTQLAPRAAREALRVAETFTTVTVTRKVTRRRAKSKEPGQTQLAAPAAGEILRIVGPMQVDEPGEKPGEDPGNSEEPPQ